jgi:hypothetical protein
MYVRTSEALGTLPRSGLYDSSIDGIGDSSRKPVLLTHYHVRMVLHPGTGLLSDSDASVMTAAQMKPGYVDLADPRRVSLQTEVAKMIRDHFQAAVSPKVNLRIGLVDMTEAKYHTPIFAGFWAFNTGNPAGGAAMEVDSLAKILALYAVYQLSFDLNTFAARKGIMKGSALQVSIANEWKKAGLRSQPKLTNLLKFVETPGNPVKTELRQEPKIHGNWDARALIVNLGFEYIGSVALQSGLFDEKQGGLWLRAAYEKPAITWGSSPFTTLPRHGATALSVATFFTLLAQGRLVDQASSNKIAKVLKSVQCLENGLLDGVKHLPGAAAESANKCGRFPPRYHDAIHMIRQPVGGKRLQYVAVVLSEEPPELDFTKLGKELDSIIARQNP